jgi:starch-binding outer membrane protein, SusD/RagB family
MKNKVSYFLIFLVVGVLAGCKKDFLEDMKSYDRFDENMFTNEAQTGFYIDRLYHWYFSNYNSPTKTLVGVHNEDRRNITEEFAGGTPHNYINPNKTLKLASEADAYYGAVLPSGINNNAYTRIRAANVLLEKIDGIGKDLPEGFRSTAKGQMFFLRALQYFDLVRVYGGVPIVIKTQTASADDESIRLPRAKTSEVIAQIVKDLDSAALLLPMKWDDANFGRLSAAGALAMKSRVLLTAASPLFNADWDNAGSDKWQKALDAGLAAETALTAAGYGNAINSAKDWAEATFKNDNKFHGEGLIVQLLSSNSTSTLSIYNGWENSIRPKDHNGSGNGISAPKQMLDLFPLANGLRPTAANGYVDTFFFENRDPRFYRTFGFSGVRWGVKDKPTKVTWFYRWRETATAPVSYYANNQTNSPAVVRKMSNPNADSTVFNISGTDIFEYRFGELLLNIAEAYAGKGDINNAVTYLGKIRKRIGIPQGANNYGIGTPADKYAALEACLYERRVELAYEGKRFWDMQRWMLYDDAASIGDNTNVKLGIPALNGTTRQGYYWQAKTLSKNDPIPAAERNISIDPDGTPANFATEIGKLKTFYQNRLVMTPLDQAWDRDGSTPISILYRPNYYISGYTGTILSNNPWLPQTKGWLDYNGSEGTFDYRQ